MIIGAPLHITADMLTTLNVSYVVNGSHTTDHLFRESGYTEDVEVTDPHAAARKLCSIRML